MVGAPSTGPLGNAEVATRGSGRSTSGASPSLPFWLPFFSTSLPPPSVSICEGGGRQRRAGVSGRGLEFHLNDCPSAHAAPRSRPACAPQPAPAHCRPAGGRPRRDPETAGFPRSRGPDLATLAAAALSSRAPRTSAPGQAREARRRRAGREPLSPQPSLEEVCGSRAPSAFGARPDVSRGARRPRATAALAGRRGGGLLYGIWTPAFPSRAGAPATALAQSAASR